MRTRRRIAVLVASAAVVATSLVALAPSGHAAGPVVLAACTSPQWAEGTTYAAGARVTYQSRTYEAIIAHTAVPGAGWNPVAAPTLWRDLGSCEGGGTTPPQPPPAGNPTTGWRQAAFTFNVQKPYNLNQSDRYRFDAATGTHTLWVYSTDMPLSQGSATDPRTELRWLQEYSSGEHMFDADVYVPSGTSGATIMQILRVRGGAPGTPATDIMLNAFNNEGGSLRPSYSTRPAVKTNMYNTWFNLKVAHNPGTGQIRVWVDNQLKLTTTDNGPATRHFKNGVYHHGSGRAEARFRNIRYWVR
jgi:hypothetical protein